MSTNYVVNPGAEVDDTATQENNGATVDRVTNHKYAGVGAFHCICAGSAADESIGWFAPVPPYSGIKSWAAGAWLSGVGTVNLSLVLWGTAYGYMRTGTTLCTLSGDPDVFQFYRVTASSLAADAIVDATIYMGGGTLFGGQTVAAEWYADDLSLRLGLTGSQKMRRSNFELRPAY